MRRALTILLPLAVVFALALWRTEGPAARDEATPRSEFSSARAMKVLRATLVDGVPHPIGTRANQRVRARIETQFRALGYQTSVQRRLGCNAGAVCGMVENVIARPPGPAAGDIVLLVSHYDSVGAGPGASDDGMGVATMLEVARAIRGETFRNRVAFLIDDGEEAGLLGAEAFVADPTLMKDVAVVINVEMRGTHGASNMFETSRGNRWLIRHYARAVPAPQASSLFYAIYNLLPNDTDVTVFKRGGTAAINFAAIRGVKWYHTPFDDLAHVSPRTLQHHGDNVLGTLRALANADLAARSNTDATFFDVLGFFLVWWPQEWTLWITVISLLLLVFAARHTPPRGMTFGVLATFTAIILAALGGAGVSWLARLHSGETNFVARPTASVVAMWLTGIAAALIAAALFNRRKDPLAMLYGVAIVWHMIGVALAALIPGAAFLFIVPAVAVTICALARFEEVVTSAVAATVAAIVMFPLGILLYDALGGRLMAAVAILIGAFATLVAPLFARKGPAITFTVLAVATGFVAMTRPASTSDQPVAIPLSYVDDPKAAGPRWMVEKLTEPLRHAARFARADESLTPWSGGVSWAAPAPPQNLARVALSGTRQGNRVTLRVQTRRGANRMTVLVRNGKVLRVNGVTPPPRPPRFRERAPSGWDYAVLHGAPVMEVEVETAGRIEVIASDTSYELPSTGAALVRARNASPATTVHEGDVTITRARGAF